MAKYGWISVKERLPEPACAVLVFAQYGPEPSYEIELGELRRDGTWMLIGEDWKINVSHWMPLPPPPQDSGGDG